MTPLIYQMSKMGLPPLFPQICTGLHRSVQILDADLCRSVQICAVLYVILRAFRATACNVTEGE